MPEKILIIDDEKNICRSIKLILDAENYQTRIAMDGIQGLNLFTDFKPDLVLLDINMPGLDGLEVLQEIKLRSQDVAVIIISGYGTIQNAMTATRLGAYDFIEKPITKEKLLISTRRALENRSLQTENLLLKRQVAARYEMVGTSPALQSIRHQIARVAPTNGRVLITGESGTGKELVARAIHENSLRQKGPFIKVNCAAIPEELIESELFGSVKGAYTGAIVERDGKFLLADQGTIFLDEIGDMSLKVQAKVLRVLQEGEFERVGGSDTIKVDVRVIAATNKNLDKEVEAGVFRNDLLYRLNVVPIQVPPLRHRKDDIPVLVENFIKHYCADNGFRLKKIHPEAMALLMDYDWPGNIRELNNLCERLVIMSMQQDIAVADLPDTIRKPPAAFSTSLSGDKTLKEVKEEVERKYIQWSLEQTGWNITQTARLLGIERTNLHKKINYYKIKTFSFNKF